MKVLGLETSCDETGVAVFDTERGLLAEALHSQVDQAGTERPDAIAYTAGPGLVGALMVGSGLANGLAYAWRCPVIAVHHMEGHLLAPMLEDDAPEFPFLALLVSGGHTMLVQVASLGAYDVLGTTLDDAVGEAFDKTAKLLGLPYPGGPALQKLAESGNSRAYAFPRPMLKREGFDFSFSGLKTAVMLSVRGAEKDGPIEASAADIAASFQQAAVDTLVGRTLQAAEAGGVDRIVVAGGVGANRLLRQQLAERFAGTVYYPRGKYCTDNGAMIAIAGAMRLSDAASPGDVRAMARWPLQSLRTPQEKDSDG
jgi:N6-L-threonylcarbamoyladenine synthase